MDSHEIETRMAALRTAEVRSALAELRRRERVLEGAVRLAEAAQRRAEKNLPEREDDADAD